MKWVFSFLLFIVYASGVSAEEFNAGFVQGLWYGDEKVFADKPTRVYVAIRNNTGADLTGTVEFFDNEKRIERNNVSALNGRIIESWADWTPTYGSHTLSATLTRIELHVVGSSTKAVEVTAGLADDVIFVDYDTDGDGIGNEEDEDDDGDGISDKAEKENGTDPLTYDKPAEVSDEASSDTSADSEDDDENDSTDTPTRDRSSDNPEGLEQFLTESRADSTLSSVTDIVNTTKKKVDAYRAERNAAIAVATEEATSTDSIAESDENGFGTITRSQNTDGGGAGFFKSLFTFIGNLLSSLYTLLLFLTSLVLGHPVFIQLLLLFLILFLIFKLAQRLGARPK